MILFLRENECQETDREKQPFSSNTGSGCTLCFNIGWPGVGEEGEDKGFKFSFSREFCYLTFNRYFFLSCI